MTEDASEVAAGRLRSGTGRAIGAVRGGGERMGLDTGRFGVFLHVNKAVIRGVVLGAALLLYAMADHPTGGFTLGLLAVGAVVLLLVELLARPPAAAAAEPGSPAAPPPSS